MQSLREGKEEKKKTDRLQGNEDKAGKEGGGEEGKKRATPTPPLRIPAIRAK